MGARQLIEKRVPQESKCVAAGGAERPKKGASLFFLAFWGFAWRFEGGFTPFTPTSLLKKA